MKVGAYTQDMVLHFLALKKTLHFSFFLSYQSFLKLLNLALYIAIFFNNQIIQIEFQTNVLSMICLFINLAV